MEQGLAGLLHATGPWEMGTYLGFVQLLAQPGPWSGTARVLVGTQSPGEAAWDGIVQRAGDVQRADVQHADVQDIAYRSHSPQSQQAGACYWALGAGCPPLYMLVSLERRRGVMLVQPRVWSKVGTTLPPLP